MIREENSSQTGIDIGMQMSATQNVLFRLFVVIINCYCLIKVVLQLLPSCVNDNIVSKIMMDHYNEQQLTNDTISSSSSSFTSSLASMEFNEVS